MMTAHLQICWNESLRKKHHGRMFVLYSICILTGCPKKSLLYIWRIETTILADESVMSPRVELYRLVPGPENKQVALTSL
jgi:hypothetical protein